MGESGTVNLLVRSRLVLHISRIGITMWRYILAFCFLPWYIIFCTHWSLNIAFNLATKGNLMCSHNNLQCKTVGLVVNSITEGQRILMLNIFYQLHWSCFTPLSESCSSCYMLVCLCFLFVAVWHLFPSNHYMLTTLFFILPPFVLCFLPLRSWETCSMPANLQYTVHDV